jgi:dihydroorotate dehydrogenase/NAD-dependent dihydropyrimidine dehydrogenase PreA subunit
MADLSVRFAGLTLENPLIAAAGPITGNVEMAKKLSDAGVAAIVSKTSFVKREYEKWVGRRNIFPYKPVYKYQGLARGRLLSLPTQSDVPVDELARRVETIKKSGITVIASVIGLSVGGYVESAKLFENAGADAIELNFCCTIPEFTTLYRYAGENVTLNPKKYAKLIKAVKQVVSIPVGAKSTVSLAVYAKIFEGLLRAKIANRLPDFITLTGQLDQNPGIDLETLEPLIPHVSTFGWQGSLSNLTYSALGTFSSSLGTETPKLSASGGIRDHQGVITAMALGATTVQIHTAILDKGPAVLSRILEKLDAHLDGHGISRIEEIIGKASRGYIPSFLIGRFMRERDHLFGTVYAGVEDELCNGCGICESVCTENAIAVNEKTVAIDRAQCRGCNLCVLKCPTQALRLENYHELEAMIERFKSSPHARSFKQFMQKDRVGLLDIASLPGKLKSWGFR